MAENVTPLRSIQGEQQAATGRVRAADENVGMEFTDIDNDGLFIRRLTCTCCRLAVRVEKWEGIQRGRRLRFQRVASHLEYRTGDDGQTYLAPTGQGHMTPRQIADSVASKALQGQSLAALRKAAKRTSRTTR